MVKEQIWLRSKDGDVIVQTGQCNCREAGEPGQE